MSATSAYDVLVVGAGIFGITAVLELSERGYDVAALDSGPLPHPLAASTDISKAVRIDYGADEDYVVLAEQAREGWLRWNEEFGDPVYHEVGLTMLTQSPLAPGDFEYESYRLLSSRGHELERLDSAAIARRLPAWNADLYVDGYFNPQAGYAESGRVVEFLVGRAADEGVTLQAGQRVDALIEQDSRVIGVRTDSGQTFAADHVVVAAGAWTPLLVSDLAPVMRSVGQPVFHLQPADPSLFAPPNFFVFGADVSKTGWYGFPVHPHAGVVKIAHHGPGRLIHPAAGERVVTDAQVESLRTFLAESLPPLADAPLVHTRCCLYCDTLDEHFWIARHPDLDGLTVAAGGSGHGFKFAPVLGGLTADAVEGQRNRHLEKFRWRALSPDTAGEEGTRYHGAE